MPFSSSETISTIFFAQDSIYSSIISLKRGYCLCFIFSYLSSSFSLFILLSEVQKCISVLFTKPEQAVHSQTLLPLPLFWWSATYSDSRYLFILCCFESKIFLLCFWGNSLKTIPIYCFTDLDVRVWNGPVQVWDGLLTSCWQGCVPFWSFLGRIHSFACSIF